jgi:hypothetical protein
VRGRAVVVAVVALLITGCGGGERSRVEDALNDFVEAVLADEDQKACSLLTPFEQRITAGRSYPDTTCASGIRLLRDGDEVRLLRHARDNHGSVTLIGPDRAEIQVPPLGGSEFEPITFRKIDGAWRLHNVIFLDEFQSQDGRANG